MGRANRLHLRVIARLDAQVRLPPGGDWNDALVKDLSVTGAGMLTHDSLALQSEVGLRVLPAAPDPARAHGESIEPTALVVRSERLPSPELGFRSLAGLHCLPLSGDVFRRLQLFVWENREREAP